jgi:hypothetical protein
MRLWTTQPLWIFEALMNQGEFYFDSEMREHYNETDKEHWQWLDAYEWLKIQMNHHGIMRPEKAKDLGWAWYLWTEKEHYPMGYWIKRGLNPKHDENMLESDYSNVRIELEIADNKVLLSDYYAWHHVMSYSFLDFDQPTNLFDDRARKEFGDIIRHPVCYGHWDKEIQQSWEKIFDLPLAQRILNELDERDNKNIENYHCPLNPVQATFWSMNLSEVVQAEQFFFKGKKKLLYKNDAYSQYKKENSIY